MKTVSALCTCLVSISLMPLSITAQTGASAGEWASFGGDPGSTKYTPLDQIDHGNVADLEVVWRWQSADAGFDLDRLTEQFPALRIPNDVDGVGINNFKAAPLMVGGSLYVTTALYQAAAIDAATGETRWIHDPRSYASGIPITRLGFSSRGLAYWSDERRASVIWGTGDAYLIQVDALSGEPVAGFGENGRVDLMQGIPRARREAPINYSITSPPVVVGDVIVVGSAVSDQPESKEAPPGDVRGYDVNTGALLWTFHTIPRPGEPGNETWEEGSWQYSGATNVWSLMSADPETGYVYLPVGSPTNDFFGAHRLGDNLYANSLVALDAATGERIWHHQLVHHDLWDSDPPAAPNLVDITVGGSDIRAVAQVTKHGFVFVFDRLTGEPAWPIEERPVPASDIPGERAATSQPFPTKPPPFERQGIVHDDLIDFTPELRQEAIAILERHRYGPLFTPPSLRGSASDATLGTVHLPGYVGGANWNGAAVDPESGILYIPSITNPTRSGLVAPESADATLRYVRDVNTVDGPHGLPLLKPPYGRITAIDLNAGEILWQRPNGPGSPNIREHPALAGIELPPLGGGRDHVLVTRTLLFSAQANVNSDGVHPLVARDKLSGEVIAEVPLPGRPLGPPVSYLHQGKQYIALTVRGTVPELVVLGLP